jgi:phosphopantothenoylcysteine decarboxylase/phosphopantothenate--cysteine ligase
VLAATPEAHAVVMAAAVADFRPKAPAETKLRRSDGLPELVLEPTPDILRELSRVPGERVLVGFAAETQDPVGEGRRKLRDKDVDLLVANVVGREGTGFGAETNEAAILAADGDDVALRTWTKQELASAIVDRLSSLLG